MKWGILATGNIAKKFASTINQMSKENEQLVAVGSRNIESAKAFANEHDIPRYYDSYEALVKDQDVEAVYVATPNTLHYENCRLCLEHGKHVLCEKPFTIMINRHRNCTGWQGIGIFLSWRDSGYGFFHCMIVYTVSYSKELLEK